MGSTATYDRDVLEEKLDDPTAQPFYLPLQFLKDITCNFSKEQELGSGGYGVVYKGVLRSGKIIAVKKIFGKIFGKHLVEDGQFQRELSYIGMKHQNIVQLVGYCAESRWETYKLSSGKHIMAELPTRLLCFEYLPNNSLDKYFSDESSGLDWYKRFEIIKGICSGLHFLHEKHIVHLDLKPQNILMDATMMPKVSDFGLSRLLSTESRAGSRGYMAPEYSFQGIASSKADIFSFGVIITEIITGGRDYPQVCSVPDLQKFGGHQSIQQYIDSVLGRWRNIFQKEPKYTSVEICTKQVKECITIALRCVDHDKSRRPNAWEIFQMLSAVESMECRAEYFKDSVVHQVQEEVQAGLVRSPTNIERQPTLKPTLKQLHMDCEASKLNLLERMLSDETSEPTDLPISLLKTITEDFSEDRQIGRGGFAVVYKGFLGNGRAIAAKKLSDSIDIDETKYNNEVDCLMRARHKNIVRFLGYCADSHGKISDFERKFVMASVRHRLLCFEYLRNGNLHDYITDASGGLEWRERYKILKGICEGLCHLHEANIVHLDLKPTNILLDDDMVPKLSDFGLSRRFGENQTRMITSQLYGTLGYLAPEFHSGVITLKLDIYSLGVLFTEILTGQKEPSLVDDVLQNWRNRFEISSAETLLEQVRVCAQISIECMDPVPGKRPVIQHIVQRLKETERADQL